MIGPLFLGLLLVAAPRDPGPGTVIVHAPWGSGGEALGRRDGHESSPEGPMSFAVSSLGDVWVLDQVNARVVHFRADGRYGGELPLPATTFQDLEVAPDGRVLVLDRLVRGSILVLDPLNGEAREHAITALKIGEGGAITAMLSRNDGVWLELEHRGSVRVLDTSLEPCPGSLVPGRPSWRTGEFLEAALDHGGGAEVRLRAADHGELLALSVQETDPLARLAWVEDDPVESRIVAAFHVMVFEEPGGATPREYDGVRVWDRRGRLLAAFRSPWIIREWEQFREFDVAPDGSIWQLAIAADGVRILRWSW